MCCRRRSEFLSNNLTRPSIYGGEVLTDHSCWHHFAAHHKVKKPLPSPPDTHDKNAIEAKEHDTEKRVAHI